MNYVEHIDQSAFDGLEPIAESDQFAIYAVGADTYVLVQRHGGTPWTALRLSGDGMFRVGSLLVDAMRHLYRDVASHLSPIALDARAERSAASTAKGSPVGEPTSL
jgi:hypothetical protein